MNTETMLGVFAIVAALGLLGVMMILDVYTPQPAEVKGCNNGITFNASQGRCFH
jgi:hypothetical protein